MSYFGNYNSIGDDALEEGSGSFKMDKPEE